MAMPHAGHAPSVRPGDMMRHVVRVAADPASRFKILYHFCLFLAAGLFSIIGIGYAIGGPIIGGGKGFALLERWEPGGVQTHGGIMLGVGLAIAAFKWRDGYNTLNRVALVIGTFYASWTAFLIFGSWFSQPVSWASPWFYLALGLLCLACAILGPPVSDLQRDRELPEGRRSA